MELDPFDVSFQNFMFARSQSIYLQIYRPVNIKFKTVRNRLKNNYK